MLPATFHLVPLTPDDREWVRARWTSEWGDASLLSRGRRHVPEDLSGGFVAVRKKGGERIGLLTYRLDETHAGRECEVVSLDSSREGVGVGTALLAAAREAAVAAGASRLWLITTNDNLRALGFYQKRGFRLVAVHPGSVDEMRRQKPQIPEVGRNGIPLHDEIELEIRL